MSGLPYSTVNSLLRGKSDSPNLKTLIRIATAFNMTIVEFLNVPEIIEFSEDDLEDESEKNEGQEETNKALREVVHRGEQFTVCSILSYRALLPRILYEIQNFFTHFAFILFYLVIVKCGKICGNTLKPQIGFVVCAYHIYYTHQYHPCQIETIGKKKRGTEMYPSSFIQGTHRFPHGLGIPA